MEAALRNARAATAELDTAAARLAAEARSTLERARAPVPDLEPAQRTGKLRAREAVRRSR